MRLLIVEDEPKMARVLRRGLEEEGYAIDMSADGVDALHMATENEYDAVILDVMLPELDGVEVCRQMRERGRWAPVLMLTAKDAITDRVRGLDSGADDYLTKPFSFDELLARLRSLVRRGVRERPVVIRVGPLTMDPARRRVRHSGTDVQLSAKEYALLEYFMRHPGEVLSRTRILEHVWDYNYDGGSNVVDVYVRYLRKKIDEPFGTSLLRTIRGAGYVLDS
jgi:two-component system, OmpR family, response regulator